MNNDIVTRLKNWNDYREVPSLTEKAADEIEQLRESNKAAWVFNEELEKKNAELLGKTEELRQQRDEARRDVCDMMHITGFLAGDYAASRGWDCFPDDFQDEEETK